MREEPEIHTHDGLWIPSLRLRRTPE
jgi:hypothetical protein